MNEIVGADADPMTQTRNAGKYKRKSWARQALNEA